MGMKFSKIAYLGKLNQYTKSELIQHLKGFQVSTLESGETNELIRFEGENTVVEIRFDLHGNFLGLESETWLDLNQVFTFPILKY
jgi:hypothetical protein